VGVAGSDGQGGLIARSAVASLITGPVNDGRAAGELDEP
jgi:hypothetical protein